MDVDRRAFGNLRGRAISVLALLLLATAGCHTMTCSPPLCVKDDAHQMIPVHPTAPRELAKAILPPYRIEPPDVLLIDAINVSPKSPYVLRVLDALVIQVSEALPDAPISGEYAIEPGGLIHLGGAYGSIKVAGMTVDEARDAIEQQLQQTLREPTVWVGLAQIAGKQQISGEHLVAQDGTVMLGSYGKVQVVGQTLEEAKATIERHLSATLENPEISIDVYSYNSKNFYVITQGAELGDAVIRFPITGNDTVLDAISQVNGLTSVSSTKIWIARPGFTPDGQDQIMPVDWIGLTQRADATTNYQLLPGDRVYVAEDKKVATDNYLAKLIAPMERIMGFSLLGAATIGQLNNVKGNAGFGRGGF